MRKALVPLLALALILPTAASAATPAQAPKASNFAMATVAGGLHFSWTKAPQHQVTYTVSSTPPGLSCHVVDKPECTISVLSPGSWSFQLQASSTRGASSSPATKVVTTRPLVILAGQSNALGATSYATDPVTKINYFAAPYASPADTQDQISWTTRSLLPPRDSAGRVIAAAVPLATTQLSSPHLSDRLSGIAPLFGPEIGFARELWSKHPTPVTFVKAVQIGTSLAAVSSRDDWDPRSGALYADMLRKITQIESSDAKLGILDVPAAFIWFQGETDALDPAMSAAYQANLARLITSLRTALTSAQLPVALIKPSLAAQAAFLHPGCAACFTDGQVRAADDWAASNISRVAAVDSLGANRTKASDYLHLSNVGELSVGKAAADAVEPLMTWLPQS